MRELHQDHQGADELSQCGKAVTARSSNEPCPGGMRKLHRSLVIVTLPCYLGTRIHPTRDEDNKNEMVAPQTTRRQDGNITRT
jgi:hypothetical protein